MNRVSRLLGGIAFHIVLSIFIHFVLRTHGLAFFLDLLNGVWLWINIDIVPAGKRRVLQSIFGYTNTFLEEGVNYTMKPFYWSKKSEEITKKEDEYQRDIVVQSSDNNQLFGTLKFWFIVRDHAMIQSRLEKGLDQAIDTMYKLIEQALFDVCSEVSTANLAKDKCTFSIDGRSFDSVERAVGWVLRLFFNGGPWVVPGSYCEILRVDISKLNPTPEVQVMLDRTIDASKNAEVAVINREALAETIGRLKGILTGASDTSILEASQISNPGQYEKESYEKKVQRFEVDQKVLDAGLEALKSFKK
ncbi:MAG: hypothetical protein KDC56_11305 [Flavobacteriaceae bacterium]|nr:hypothetical protein [Candidatus Nomurabacteria bacterium]MCB0473635.1 hypothetical protein [Flavobacteriaceae bacterium]